MVIIQQAKLSQLCLNINVADGDYLLCLQYGIRDVVDWFNTYWISVFSKEISGEIEYNLNIYIKGITAIFTNLNKKVKNEVEKHNANPDISKKIYYRGFSVSEPYNVKDLLNLNIRLPDGKTGLINDNINYPFQKIISTIEESSFILKSSVSKSEALSDSEIELIQQKIVYYEKKFVNFVRELLEIVLEKEKLI